MDNEQKIIGFINLFHVTPDFVYPVIKKERDLYFVDSKDGRIVNYIKAPKNLSTSNLVFCDIENMDIKTKIGGSAIVAYQMKNKKVIYGTISKIKKVMELTIYRNPRLIDIDDYMLLITDNKSKILNNPLSVNNDLDCIVAIARRNNTTAFVRMLPGTGMIKINDCDIKKFFGIKDLEKKVLEPLLLTDTQSKFDININVNGDETKAQVGTMRRAIANALMKAEPELCTELLNAGYLNSDIRRNKNNKNVLKVARHTPRLQPRH